MAVGIPKNSNSKRTDFELYYEGKQSIEEILNTSIRSRYKVIRQKGKLSPNYLYFGDNLDVLKYLIHECDFKGKVDLIYIDPPFAKGAHFSSRSQELAYTDVLDGAEYIEFIRQRLYLLRELLSDKGSIYVHLDETMAFEIKIIMDEVFGKKNFRNWIVRKKSNPKNSTSKKYGNITDYIMFYTKTNNYIFNQPYEPWEEESLLKEFLYVEEETGRRYKRVPIHAPGVRNGETGKAWRGILPPEGKHWQYTPKKLDELDKKGEIYWSKNGNPRRKIYMDQNKGKKVQDIWLDFKDAHNQNIKITGYPTEKSPDLLKRIISTSSNEGSIVLDAFNGSGTTLSVASELNRKWIAIDNSKVSIETTLKRIFKGTEKMGDFVTKNNHSIELKLFDDENPFIDDFSLVSDVSLIEELNLTDYEEFFN